MKVIEVLSEQIEEEVHDARKYIECAIFHKEDHPELADVYRRLANEELKHVDLLHERVTTLISDYKDEHGKPPEHMQWVYNYLHEKHIKEVNEVKVLIASF